MSVLFERKEKIAIITINRPEAMNSLDGETLDGLNKCWIEFRDDPDLWVAIITGAGTGPFVRRRSQESARLLQQHDTYREEREGRKGARGRRDYTQP